MKPVSPSSAVLLLALLAVPVTVIGATYEVRPTGCSDVTCDPCCTIQQAVSRSEPGDTVSVHTGTYLESVDISLMGVPGDLTIAAADGPLTALVSSTGAPAFHCPTPHPGGLVVTGFEVSASLADAVLLDTTGDVQLSAITVVGTAAGSGLVIDTQGDVTVTDCTANLTGGGGIVITAAGEAWLADCTANTNAHQGISVGFYDPGPPDPPDPPDRVVAVRCTTINNGTAADFDYAGLDVVGYPSVAVIDCTSNDNFGPGIFAAAGTSMTVLRCEARRNGLGASFVDSGMFLFAPTATTVVRNTVADGNGGHGARIDLVDNEKMQGAGMEVVGCTLTANGGYGLGIDPPGKEAEDPPSTRFFVGNTMFCSDISGNTTGGLALDEPLVVDARSNWWGDASGPSGIGGGSGDAIHPGPGTVSFNPWLLAPFAQSPDCPIFLDHFETGTTLAWDTVRGARD